MEPSKPAVFDLLNLVRKLNSSSFIPVSFGLSLCCPPHHVSPLLVALFCTVLHCSLASLVKEIYCSPTLPFDLSGRGWTKHLHSILRFQ